MLKICTIRRQMELCLRQRNYHGKTNPRLSAILCAIRKWLIFWSKKSLTANKWSYSIQSNGIYAVYSILSQWTEIKSERFQNFSWQWSNFIPILTGLEFIGKTPNRFPIFQQRFEKVWSKILSNLPSAIILLIGISCLAFYSTIVNYLLELLLLPILDIVQYFHIN